ncbi:condensation domain-containing protein [Micromonospora sp. NPDC049662]|uniref:non-ribosomal peptide synthetase n=1 Tax=Micromonospora sp. NPDC049662 TaxID=3155397 RepID=UPI00341407FB
MSDVTEKLVVEAFTEVLGHQDVSSHTSFRALGGDSLRAVRVAACLAARFDAPAGTEEAILEALLDGACASTIADLLADVTPVDDRQPGDASTATDGSTSKLSFGEERLWLNAQYHPDSAAYHIVNAVRVTGLLDLAALDRAATEVLAIHPALRTRYDEDAPVAYVNPTSTVTPDISHQAVSDWPEAMARAQASANVPFDLSRGNLLRLRTYRCGEQQWLVLLVVHHVAADGWSMGLIFRTLAAAYSGALDSESTDGRRRGYREFAQWQRQAVGSDAEEWAGRLLPLPPRVELEPGRRRPPVRSQAGATLDTSLPAPMVHRLSELASETGTSLFTVLLTLLHLCLARRTGQWEALIGTVVSARTRAVDHDTVGFFANTVPIRLSASRQDAVSTLVASIGEQWRYVLAHQHVPLEELTWQVRATPDPARTPLVDIVFILQDGDVGAMTLPGCATEPVLVPTGTARFDLMLEAIPSGAGGLQLRWEYATEVIDGETVRRVSESLAHLVAVVAADPYQPVRQAVQLSPAEVDQLAVMAPRSTDDVPVTDDLTRWFDRTAARAPDATAVIDGPLIMSFDGLRDLRDRMAWGLRTAGVRPGDPVAVRMPRSAESVAAMLATWAVGGVLLMIDTTYPPDHQERLLRVCDPAAILTDEPSSWTECPTVRSDAPSPMSSYVEAYQPSPDDPAWLVATSGSTGIPKVTAGTYGGLYNRCAWGSTAWPYVAGERAALRTPLGFVDTLSETLVPLLAGMPVVVVPESASWDIPALVEILARHRVTRLLVTPSLMRTILDVVDDAAVLSDLRVCTFSGEALDADLLARVQRALPGCRLVNLYGSAEVAGDATFADITGFDGPDVPLGRPIAGTSVLIVDQDGESVPPGGIGEVVVRGAPVGLGYLSPNRPGRGTRLMERLEQVGGYQVPDSVGTGYRTGDLGWLAPDGQLRFAGRRDRQVKIRGCRVELGHVEAALRTVGGVSDAVAWAEPRVGGARLLAAVAGPGDTAQGNAVRDSLRGVLPAYMVPSQVAVVDALAVNPNGKLDRAAVIAAVQHRQPPTAPAAGTALERRIQRIWADFLDGEVVGPEQSFFACGGDSLAANRMLAAVMSETGALVELRRFLDVPTIRGLAAQVDAEAGAVSAGERR